ncbi:hypothetical protein DASC09_011260 [Saccharomycopsis crataegensis]|uniref:Secreted protein n=1 Tax=Saccharomycopsis crataegensis TaxID=43959 RepID=A0AAV5QGF6_9ASCO|nr:hypothetical protein DASC09_011260 [Saccharomycopsis crataegensis]
MRLLCYFLQLISVSMVISAVPVYEKQYNGIFGKLCDVAVSRMKKFGECVSKIPEFKQLNSSFWYQAAEKTLCGENVKASVNNTHSRLYLPGASLPIGAIELARLPNNDTTGELDAQYLFNLANTTMQRPFKNWGVDTVANKKNLDANDTDPLSPTFGKAQCMNLCSLIQESIDQLQFCWSIISMTVIYGVCEVGCTIL